MKLKQCPFCGSKAKKYDSYDGDCQIIHTAACFFTYINMKEMWLVIDLIDKSPGHGMIAWNQRADNWIPVSKKLPEDEQRVLTLSPIYPIGSNMRYRILQGQFVKICTEVTHWRLLPDPPEVKNDIS